MEKNKKYNQIVEWIKECGKSISENAEIIAGGYQYQTGDLDIIIKINDTEIPTINVSQEFIPELIVEGAKRSVHE